MPSATIAEIIIFTLFFILIFRFFQQKKPEELITLVFPVILFVSFIEVMAIEAGKSVYNYQGFHFFILKSPIGAILIYLLIFYFSFLITNKIFSRFNVPVYLLSFSDAILCTIMALIIAPIQLKLGWWSFAPPSNYLIKGHFFGVPLWEFFGVFLMGLTFSLGYRFFRKFDFKKRVIFTYSYLSFILAARFFLYLITPRL